MRITGDCIYGKDVFETVMRLSFFKPKHPRRRFCVMIAESLLLLVLSLLMLCLKPQALGFPLLMTVLMVLLLGMELYLWYGVPRMQYRALGAMKEVKQQYVFTEQAMEVITQTDGVDGKTILRYDTLYQIVETERYILLYQNKGSAFVVDKASLRHAEDAETSDKDALKCLTGRLCGAVGKYIDSQY